MQTRQNKNKDSRNGFGFVPCGCGQSGQGGTAEPAHVWFDHRSSHAPFAPPAPALPIALPDCSRVPVCVTWHDAAARQGTLEQDLPDPAGLLLTMWPLFSNAGLADVRVRAKAKPVEVLTTLWRQLRQIMDNQVQLNILLTGPKVTAELIVPDHLEHMTLYWFPLDILLKVRRENWRLALFLRRALALLNKYTPLEFGNDWLEENFADDMAFQADQCREDGGDGEEYKSALDAVAGNQWMLRWLRSPVELDWFARYMTAGWLEPRWQDWAFRLLGIIDFFRHGKVTVDDGALEFGAMHPMDYFKLVWSEPLFIEYLDENFNHVVGNEGLANFMVTTTLLGPEGGESPLMAWSRCAGAGLAIGDFGVLILNLNKWTDAWGDA